MAKRGEGEESGGRGGERREGERGTERERERERERRERGCVKGERVRPLSSVYTPQCGSGFPHWVSDVTLEINSCPFAMATAGHSVRMRECSDTPTLWWIITPLA